MSRPYEADASVPAPSDPHLARGYGTQSTTGINDFAQANPTVVSPLAQSAASNPHSGAYIADEDGADGLNRSSSTASTAVPVAAPSRSNTLKKKTSIRRSGSTKSLRRSASKRSLAAGSIKGVPSATDNEDFHSAFHTPIPTAGSPTEILANRFQAWRQLLKSLITYFREVQNSYDMRVKAVHKVQNTLSNITNPSIFMSEEGLGDATRMLESYHKKSLAEATKSRDIENDVIGALSGLRSDLGQKIKEIKSLSGDFKNSVEKEKEGTRREVDKLLEALQHADHEDGSAIGKNDPFVVKLGVDRMIERQIDEENYLHRAYLNLESSGRELESIVVGEIQKAYNALAGILKREADDAYSVVEDLRTGPISMPKDQEWNHFVTNDPHFVDPNIPLRRIEDIEYPGKRNPAAQEVRAGMLERKSKYLKSYTPGWYVLSATHLHEFKSADKIYTQPPVMSLYLLDQKLGSKSEAGSSSNKFMLKGKQSGSMHKGHNWVFRAESQETMLAWYEDIRTLTESTGEARIAFVRKHARSVSGTSERGTVSSDGFEDDEADARPFSADAASLAEQNPRSEPRAVRPQPGGRFPSDLAVYRVSTQDRSSESSDPDREVVAAAAALPGSSLHAPNQDPYRLDGVASGTRDNTSYDHEAFDKTLAGGAVPLASLPPEQQKALTTGLPGPYENNKHGLPGREDMQAAAGTQYFQSTPQQPQQQSFLGSEPAGPPAGLPARHPSTYGDWMAPAAAGAGAGALGVGAYEYHKRNERDPATVPESPKPEVPEKSEARYNEPDVAQEPIAPTTMGTLVADQRKLPAEAPEPTRPPNIAAVLEDQPRSEPMAPDTVAAFITNQNSAADSNSAPMFAEPMAPGNMDADQEAAPSSFPGVEGSLGGLERKGAHETGRFPVVRHDTDMSVSALHVPGEYPKKG